MDDNFKERVEAFIKGYGALVEEHKVDFIHLPVYIPDENGAWKLTIQNQPVDTSKQPVESPFVADK